MLEDGGEIIRFRQMIEVFEGAAHASDRRTACAFEGLSRTSSAPPVRRVPLSADDRDRSRRPRATRSPEYAPTSSSSGKARLRPLGLGRSHAIVSANFVGCRPQSRSGSLIMIEKARTSNLGFEREARCPELFRGNLVGAPCRPLDRRGDAAAIFQQTPLLARLKANVGKAGAMQYRPKAVARTGEVVTGSHGTRGRIQAAENHIEAAREDIRSILCQNVHPSRPRRPMLLTIDR